MNTNERLDEETAFREAMGWKEVNETAERVLADVKRVADILKGAEKWR